MIHLFKKLLNANYVLLFPYVPILVARIRRKGSLKTPREMAPRLPFVLRDERQGKLA